MLGYPAGFISKQDEPYLRCQFSRRPCLGTQEGWCCVYCDPSPEGKARDESLEPQKELFRVKRCMPYTRTQDLPNVLSPADLSNLRHCSKSSFRSGDILIIHPCSPEFSSFVTQSKWYDNRSFWKRQFSILAMDKVTICMCCALSSMR